MAERKGYSVRDEKCTRKTCFIPFSGNGRKICRLYELGRCPPEKVKAEVISLLRSAKDRLRKL